MMAQDDEELQQLEIEKADVPISVDDDHGLGAAKHGVDEEWFYSPNYTSFTEENVLTYIAEQDKIRMMTGRYGTCTEWDFILEGGKIKKGSQDGSGEICFPLRPLLPASSVGLFIHSPASPSPPHHLVKNFSR